MLKVYMYRGRKHYFDDKTAPEGAVEVKAEEPAKAPEPEPVVEQKEKKVANKAKAPTNKAKKGTTK